MNSQCQVASPPRRRRTSTPLLALLVVVAATACDGDSESKDGARRDDLCAVYFADGSSGLAFCGDAVCDPSESSATCPWDCGMACIPLAEVPSPLGEVGMQPFCIGDSPSACGGELEGTWGISSICLERASDLDTLLELCPTADVVAVRFRPLAGTVTFAAGRMTQHLRGSFAARIDPSFCVPDSDCAETGEYFRRAGLDITCSQSVATGGCDCFLEREFLRSVTDAYTVTGNTFTLADGTTYEYCADDVGLRYVALATGEALSGRAERIPVEICNGADDDGDCLVDEAPADCPPCDTDGVCAEGAVTRCAGIDGWQCQYTSAAHEETESLCDGLDNDCDGIADELAACREICDGLDNDANGTPDDNLPPPDCARAGVCAEGANASCNGTSGWSCAYASTHHEDVETTCDGLDNNCDGVVDEPCDGQYVPVSLSDYPTRPGVLLAPPPWSAGGASIVLQSTRLYYERGGALGVVDVTDPESPSIVAEVPTEPHGIPLPLDVEGDDAYVGVGQELRVYDVGGLPDIVAIASEAACGSDQTIQAIDVLGPRAYVACDQALVVLDVSTPSSPVEAASITSSWAKAVLATPTHVYVASEGGLAVFSTGPLAVLGLVESPGLISLALSGSTLYAGFHSPAIGTGVRVFDVSDPDRNPVLLTTLSGSGRPVLAQGSRLFSTNRLGVESWDISTPTAPVRDGFFLGMTASIGGIAANATHLFVGEPFLWIVDLAATPPEPVLLSTTVVAQGARDTLWEDNELLVATETELHTLDVADPGQPTLTSTHEVGGAIQAIASDGTGIYVLDTYGGLVKLAFDSALNNWTSLVQLDLRDGTTLAASGDRLFAARGSGGISAWDVSDFTRPTLVSQSPTTSVATCLHAEGDLLSSLEGSIVAPGLFESSVSIYDAGADLAEEAVSRLGRFALPAANYYAAAGEDRRIYVGGDELLGIDFSSPSAPIAGEPAPGPTTHMQLRDHEIAAASVAGVAIYDAASVTPHLRGRYAIEGADLVTQSDGHAFVVDRRGAVYVVEKPARALVADVDLSRRAPGSAATVRVSWIDHYPGYDERVLCVVSAGTCTVTDADQLAAAATVEWLLPVTPGGYEMAIIVGNAHYFVTRVDRVWVE